jgi:hypothetical protein
MPTGLPRGGPSLADVATIQTSRNASARKRDGNLVTEHQVSVGGGRSNSSSTTSGVPSASDSGPARLLSLPQEVLLGIHQFCDISVLESCRKNSEIGNILREWRFGKNRFIPFVGIEDYLCDLRDKSQQTDNVTGYDLWRVNPLNHMTRYRVNLECVSGNSGIAGMLRSWMHVGLKEKDSERDLLGWHEADGYLSDPEDDIAAATPVEIKRARHLQPSGLQLDTPSFRARVLLGQFDQKADEAVPEYRRNEYGHHLGWMDLPEDPRAKCPSSYDNGPNELDAHNNLPASILTFADVHAGYGLGCDSDSNPEGAKSDTEAKLPTVRFLKKHAKKIGELLDRLDEWLRDRGGRGEQVIALLAQRDFAQRKPEDEMFSVRGASRFLFLETEKGDGLLLSIRAQQTIVRKRSELMK